MFKYERTETETVYCDPDWPKATCGECAWRIGDWKLHEKSQRWGLCRRVAFSGGQEEIGKIQLDEPACPAFVRRPKK